MTKKSKKQQEKIEQKWFAILFKFIGKDKDEKKDEQRD